jgi:hypothetical protein
MKYVRKRASGTGINNERVLTQTSLMLMTRSTSIYIYIYIYIYTVLVHLKFDVYIMTPAITLSEMVITND